MIRLLPACAALAVCCGVLSSVAAMPAKQRTAVIGADKPVDLGRMVVTATPL
ncbi:hypothetical protein [Novosphingobium sp. AP12]|uniref:hypothetical protein n=1 Tax=Novosphingobium sp. AP12 TaxID=1144305 RepID=UPI0002FC1A28|nr:hypothetical protein [Novosphingobium sp. AP12]